MVNALGEDAIAISLIRSSFSARLCAVTSRREQSILVLLPSASFKVLTVSSTNMTSPPFFRWRTTPRQVPEDRRASQAFRSSSGLIHW